MQGGFVDPFHQGLIEGMAAKIRHDEKALVEILSQYVGDTQAVFRKPLADMKKRAAIFAFRWRVHDNGGTFGPVDAKIAAKTGVARGGPQAFSGKAEFGGKFSQPFV